MTARHFTILEGLDAVPEALRGAVVAIGNFDGCHRGHQTVFSTARALAARQNAPSLLVTFEPHPRDVFAPAPHLYRLTGPEQKAELAAALGFDGIAILPFSRVLGAVEAADFVADALVGALGVKGVVAGADFHFGRNRLGTPAFLAAEGERHGFAVRIVEMLEEGGVVSSSRIRDALASGDLDTANALLGYHHILAGQVVAGDRRGRDLGYPTANIVLPATSRLAQGVYAVRARLDGRLLNGVAAYGKPMFSDAPPPFETHLFDFDADLYGKTLSLALLGHIRPMRRFPDLDALIAAMDADAEAARITIARAAPLSELDAALGYLA